MRKTPEVKTHNFGTPLANPTKFERSISYGLPTNRGNFVEIVQGTCPLTAFIFPNFIKVKVFCGATPVTLQSASMEITAATRILDHRIKREARRFEV